MITSFRLATSADLPTILRLDQEIFGVYGGQEDPNIIAARLAVFPAGCAVVERHTDDETFFAGYLTTEKWAELRDPALDEDPRETHQPEGTVLNVTTFAIAPGFQNQGLGVELLDYTIDLARREGCRQIVLETARARKFYLRHGFELLKERDQRGFPLYVMRLWVG
ncbi:MAG: GNAT family N-acetyltransferase [Ardenticatenaceae bacterium]|nr:GNAT family N-acetyltransferase [Ardenticatenaceae bacterium]